MSKATTIISGYLIELDTDGDSTDCYISYNDHGTFYTASLAAADATGMLEDRNGRERRIPASTIDRITDWAVAYGY